MQSKRAARQYMNRKVRSRCCAPLRAFYVVQFRELVLRGCHRRRLACALRQLVMPWFMAPQGGFNRPLAVERTGEKALRN